MRKKITIIIIILLTNAVTYYFTSETNFNKKCEEIKYELKECDYYKGLMPFNINNYEQQIEENSLMRRVGLITSQEQALIEARKIFAEFYSQVDLAQKPLLTFIDHENGAFLIVGGLSEQSVGGETYVIISIFDGEILALWQDE